GLSVPGPDEGSRRAGSSSLCRFDADGGGGCVLRRLYDLLDGRAHQSLQDARRARRRVQSREHGGNHGRAVVRRLGVRRHAVCEPRPVRAMVAVEFRTELEDTDLDRTLAARLSRRPVGRLPGVHGREATGCARQVSVLPRRGPLGAATAQSPLVVGNGARLDRSVLEARADRSPLMGEPFLKTLTRTTVVAGALGIVLLLVLPRHGSLASDFVDTFTVAFCFTFLGHYVDRLLLALPEIRTGVGPMVRVIGWFAGGLWCAEHAHHRSQDRKSTRLHSSHRTISYAVFCLKKKKKEQKS